jgi:2-keto-4-pentenoate hydratase/2-oxohepta-3-ene-1,7-dioic acid hydratase in catechol pathway
VKLCRFELIAEPGTARSGIVYSGKVYETDGATPKGVYEAAEVRPLAPVGTPPSVRLFRNPGRLGERLEKDDLEALPYQYGNPSAIVGASQVIVPPEYVLDLQYEPYLVGIVATPGLKIPVEEADDALLGLSIMNLFVARELIRRTESGRAFDFACAVGPVVTTPDELEATVLDHEFGRRWSLTVVTRVNGVERRRGQVSNLPITLAQAVELCSEGPPLSPGDLIALGPLAPWADDEPGLEPDDEVQVSIEHLGTLSTKIAAESAV